MEGHSYVVGASGGVIPIPETPLFAGAGYDQLFTTEMEPIGYSNSVIASLGPSLECHFSDAYTNKTIFSVSVFKPVDSLYKKSCSGDGHMPL